MEARGILLGVPILERRPGQRAKFGAKRLRLLRGWCLLLMLAEPGPPSTAAELHERLRTRYPFDGLELSLQTTRDDLRLLSECGFPVVPFDADGNEIDVCEFENLTGKLKNVRWSLRAPSRLAELHCEGLPRPSVADVLALDLLRAALGQCAPAGFWLAPTVRRLLDEVANAQSAKAPKVAAKRGRVRVRILLRAAEAAHAATMLPGLHKVHESAVGDWVPVEFEAADQAEAERLALGLGEVGVVEEPETLRAAVKRRIRASSENYEGSVESVRIDRPESDRC